MIEFIAILEKFGEQGEKTGWTYIPVPAEMAQQLKPRTRTSFRVKGKIDQMVIRQVALLPMGDGSFIVPFNAEMRKQTGKRKGEKIRLKIELDSSTLNLSEEMMVCLREEPEAWNRFSKLPPSHQHYYSKWIESAKTAETKARRIAHTLSAMIKGQSYGEMLREMKNNRQML